MDAAGDEGDWLEDLLGSETLSADFVARALLQRQYFPHVKKDGEELPPLFESRSFTPEVAEAIRDLKPRVASWVEFRTRRFDGLVRRLGVPHPVPYAKLVLHIREHWDDLRPRLDSPNSQIKPEWHSDDRVIHMDYVDPVELHGRMTTLAIGKKYLVKADISNCFPSIYSHSIDWALRTRPVAKADKGSGSTAWESQLDTYVRNCINGESKGLLIGPAVSNLLAELVLQSVDGELSTFSFVRFVDDYSAYFHTREEAEDFLVALQTSLGRFRLDLNTRKTKISSLREGTGDTWMAEVFSSLPSSPSDLSAVRFLQHAEVLAQRFPGHSVMKFAAKTLLRRTDRDGIGSVLVTRELVRLTGFHPQLLPTLSHEIEKLGRLVVTQREELAEILREQLSRAIRSGETDSILWIVHILRRQLKRPTKLSKPDYEGLLQLDDDLVFVALAALERAQAPKISRRVRNLTYSDESDRQEHWLARYEFWRRGWIPDGQLSGEERTWMRVLKKRSVVFCPALG